MEDKKFKKMLKEKGPRKMIGLHTHWIVKLTNKQLYKCIELKNKI